MLEYPFQNENIPGLAEPKPVAEGVYWLRQGLPFALDHINLWLLKDGDGWTIVDTGLNHEDTRTAWLQVIENFLGAKPVHRVIVTHMHPDHIGLAGWLCDKFSCDLWMTQTEFLFCHTLLQDTGTPAPAEALRFYSQAGYSAEQLDEYKKRFGSFGRFVSPLPHSFKRLHDRDSLQIDNKYWQVVVGRGHSPEHACLFCPELKLLISGDQVLPRISSNVSVFPTDPEANPLSDWLDSCQKLREKLPDDLLVLPAHQEPFYGLHERLTELAAAHTRDLEMLVDALLEPHSAKECIAVLFGREIPKDVFQLAIGETIAHLNYLVHEGLLKRFEEAGVLRYARA